MRTVEFFVPGIPKPAGSKKGFYNKKINRVLIVDDCNKTKSWQGIVSTYALQAKQDAELHELIVDPIRVVFDFYFIRPKGHFGSGKNAMKLKPSAPAYHITKPDVLKLARAAEDALTGIIYRDDSQIYNETIGKQYATNHSGVHIKIQWEEGAKNGR